MTYFQRLVVNTLTFISLSVVFPGMIHVRGIMPAWNMLELKDPVFFNFWRPSRYCSSSNHYVLRDSQQFRLISEGPSTLRALALRSC